MDVSAPGRQDVLLRLPRARAAALAAACRYVLASLASAETIATLTDTGEPPLAPGGRNRDTLTYDDARRLGERLRTWRLRLGLTQTQLGAMAGYSRSMVDAEESGSRRSATTLASLHMVLRAYEAAEQAAAGVGQPTPVAPDADVLAFMRGLP